MANPVGCFAFEAVSDGNQVIVPLHVVPGRSFHARDRVVDRKTQAVCYEKTCLRSRDPANVVDADLVFEVAVIQAEHLHCTAPG